MILRLRAKHGSALSQPTTWLALVLVGVDIAIPLTMVLFIFLLMTQVRGH
jgi:hypothetical protein